MCYIQIRGKKSNYLIKLYIQILNLQLRGKGKRDYQNTSSFVSGDTSSFVLKQSDLKLYPLYPI